MEVLILCLRETHIRPSRLLVTIKEDPAPSLGPLLPCKSIVIITNEAKVFTKTGVRGGSVLVEQSWSQRSSSCAAKVWKSGGLHLIFRLPCRGKNDQVDDRRFETQRLDQAPHVTMEPTSIQYRSSALCEKSRYDVGHTTLSFVRSETKWCCGVVDQAFADPAVYKRMTGKFLIDVFGGSGFVAKATYHLGLRGRVLDTKFGLRCDVTQPTVTSIRQDVSAGTCVAAMISPPRQHTLFSSQVVSASASIAILLHRARMPWILEHLCDSWLWDVPKLQALAAQPRTAWVLADFCIFGSHCRKKNIVSGW